MAKWNEEVLAEWLQQHGTSDLVDLLNELEEKAKQCPNSCPCSNRKEPQEE